MQESRRANLLRSLPQKEEVPLAKERSARTVAV